MAQWQDLRDGPESLNRIIRGADAHSDIVRSLSAGSRLLVTSGPNRAVENSKADALLLAGVAVFSSRFLMK